MHLWFTPIICQWIMRKCTRSENCKSFCRNGRNLTCAILTQWTNLLRLVSTIFLYWWYLINCILVLFKGISINQSMFISQATTHRVFQAIKAFEQLYRATVCELYHKPKLQGVWWRMAASPQGRQNLGRISFGENALKVQTTHGVGLAKVELTVGGWGVGGGEEGGRLHIPTLHFLTFNFHLINPHSTLT